MWNYDKRLQYPVKIARPNPALAKVIISQLGGPHGELGAATRYLSQRFTAPNNEVIATLTDIGTEEQIPTRRVSSKSNYSCKEDILGERQYPMNVVQGKTVIDLRQPQFTEEQARAVQMEGRKAALEYKNKRNQSEW